MHASTADINIPLLVGARRPGTVETSEVPNSDRQTTTRVSVDHAYEDNVSSYFVDRSRYLLHASKLLHDVRPYEGLVFLPLSILEMLLMKYIGEIAGSVYKSLVELDDVMIRHTLIRAIALYVAFIVLAACTEWTSGMLTVVWRLRLSGVIHAAYFEKQSFGSVCSKIDNCDQRLTSEISGICSKLPSMVQTISASPLKLLFYGYLTSTYTGILSIVVVFGFFVVSIMFQKMVTIPLARGLVHFEQSEGDFRSGHMRIKNGAIDIALQPGNIAEMNHINLLFQKVLGSQRTIISRRACLVGVTKMVDYCGALLNYILISLAIFLGHRGGDGGDRAEFVSNASFFTLTFIYTLTEIVDLSESVSEVLSLLCRVYGLSDMLCATEERDEIQHTLERAGKPHSFEVIVPTTLFVPSNNTGAVMEVSILEVQGDLLADIKAVFPSAPLGQHHMITCCMTLQPRKGVDLESMDRCLNKYLGWERNMMQQLGPHFWSDSIDPKTGRALRGDPGKSWSEVYAFNTLLDYKVQQGDVCPFILHPKYGSEAYPVTFFTTASPGDCKQALESFGDLSVTADNNCILQLENTTILSPEPYLNPLLVGLHLDIKRHEHILVTGPNGCGKTTLLRHICKELQTRKDTGTYMYLPQIPIVAPGPYFWQQIAYPSDSKPSPEELQHALDRSGMLEYFESLPDGFDTIKNWDVCLSFGQKQRLCLARVFLHKPTLAILDESTTGMDTPSAIKLLTCLQKVSTCIAVTHSPDVFQNIFTVQLSIGPLEKKPSVGWRITLLP